jgi:hypothetical protein
MDFQSVYNNIITTRALWLKGVYMFNFFNKKLPTDFNQVQEKGVEISEIFYQPNQQLQEDFNLIDKVNKSKFEDFQVSSFAFDDRASQRENCWAHVASDAQYAPLSTRR